MKTKQQKGEVIIWSIDTEKTEKENLQANKWHIFQHFISKLDLDEVREIRRHLVGIEKALFKK